MIKLKQILLESYNVWMGYDKLSVSQKEALYEYMVTSGGVSDREYNNHVKMRLYKVVLINPNQVIDVFNEWGWTGHIKCKYDDDTRRINKIKTLHKKYKTVWPYIVGDGKTFKDWARDKMNHGDGYHRLCLALREHRPIEFLFIKSRV